MIGFFKLPIRTVSNAISSNTRLAAPNKEIELNSPCTARRIPSTCRVGVLGHVVEIDFWSASSSERAYLGCFLREIYRSPESHYPFGSRRFPSSRREARQPRPSPV